MIGTINVAGSIQRIGTTTFCMQLIKFLTESEYHACYVEMSRQDYIWGITNIYEGVQTNRQTGKTSYANIDMYGRERFNALFAGQLENYDFIICDYGNLLDATFDVAAFAGGDCCVVLCGNKPNEIFKTEDMLADTMLNDAITVFNFTDPADQAAILDMMGRRAHTTKFMPYIPDPFNERQDYSKSNFFQDVMDIAVSKMRI